MSIICGALKWLFDSENRRIADLENEIKVASGKLEEQGKNTDWFEAHHSQAKAKSRKFELERMLMKIKDANSKINDVSASYSSLSGGPKGVVVGVQTPPTGFG